MDKTYDPEVDKILSEAGIVDDNISNYEKQALVKTLRQSQQDFHGTSSSSKPQESPSSSSSKTLGTSMKDGEKSALLNDLKTESALGKKVLDINCPNHTNTNLSLRDMEVSKDLSSRKAARYSAAVARSPPDKLITTTTFKTAPGGPVAIQRVECDLNSSHGANTSQSKDGVWLYAGTNKENGLFTKSTSSPAIEETKQEETITKETENTSTRDNINTTHGESKDRESPENLELPRLNSLVFKSRTPTSHSVEFPCLLRLTSLTREEWLRSACQTLLARKLAQMEKNRGSKWVTLSERSINITILENAVAKSYIQPSKDDVTTNSSDRIQNKPKGSSSPPNILNSVRESSSDDVVTLSPDNGSVNAEGCDSAAIVLVESTKKQEKGEMLANSPVGRNDDYGGGDGETGRRKSSRNRKHRRGGSKASASNDDLLERGQSSSAVVKHSQRDFNASTSNHSPIGAHSPADNNAEVCSQDKKQCPMCQQDFNDMHELEQHAWECNGATSEGENKVAEQNATEPKLRKCLLQTEGDDQELQIIDKMNSLLSRKSAEVEGDDHLFERPSSVSPRKHDNDDDFVTKNAKCRTRKRNLVHSDDEDTLSKSPRK